MGGLSQHHFLMADLQNNAFNRALMRHDLGVWVILKPLAACGLNLGQWEVLQGIHPVGDKTIMGCGATIAVPSKPIQLFGDDLQLNGDMCAVLNQCAQVERFAQGQGQACLGVRWVYPGLRSKLIGHSCPPSVL